VASQQGGYLCTQLYHSPTEDLVCFVQIPGKSEQCRSCKTPHNHHHLHHHHNCVCPPCDRQKKLPPITPPHQQQMARRTNSTSQFYLSLTQRATAERTSPAAIAIFKQQVWVHDIPYWGPNCVLRILNSADGVLRDIPIGTLLTLPVLPFHVSYPVGCQSQLTHKCRYCPQIDYPGNNYPIHKFNLKSAAESHPPSTQT
jgi:hypothetical protein